jgi:hypothetical protein
MKFRKLFKIFKSFDEHLILDKDSMSNIPQINIKDIFFVVSRPLSDLFGKTVTTIELLPEI